MRRTPHQSYQNQQVMSASPAQLVAMAYDRAIASLNEAVHAIEAGDIERRWRANKRAADIIDHLSATLDEERGGQIAANLRRVYAYAARRLVEVDVHNDPQPAEEVVRLLEPLRQSWRQLAADGAGDGAQPAGLAPRGASAPADHGAAVNT